MAIISIVSELICVFVKRGGEYHLSCWNQFLVWRGCSGINAVDLSCLFVVFSFFFLSIPSPLSPCRLSPLFYPELLDSLGGKWHFLSLRLHLPACRSMTAPDTQRAHSWSYCVDRVVNYFLFSRLMKSYVFFSLAAAHLTLPSHLPLSPPPISSSPHLSSVFCVRPSSWNSSTRLTRKIGHPPVLLSPPQAFKK